MVEKMKKYKMIKPESDDCSFFGFLYFRTKSRGGYYPPVLPFLDKQLMLGYNIV
jgi:hypothetical protein